MIFVFFFFILAKNNVRIRKTTQQIKTAKRERNLGEKKKAERKSCLALSTKQTEKKKQKKNTGMAFRLEQNVSVCYCVNCSRETCIPIR